MAEQHEGANRLAQAMQRRTKELQGAKRNPLDFGEIGADMSLTTNGFPIAIPQGDYMVCRSVQWGAVGDILSQTQRQGAANSGEHTHGPNGQHGGHVGGDGTHSHSADTTEMQHVHDTLVGEKTRWLQPGDRVLVAWIGEDAVVVDLIYPATRIGRDANGYDK